MKLETLQAAMITAMKNKDKERKDTLSSLIGAIKKTAIYKKCKDNISEELVDEVILKEKKTVQEMIDSCPAERTELMQEYKNRLEIIDEFAPVILTDKNEIRTMIDTLLFESGIGAPQNLGKSVMRVVMPAMKGKADMKVVQEVMNEILQKNGEV